MRNGSGNKREFLYYILYIVFKIDIYNSYVGSNYIVNLL